LAEQAKILREEAEANNLDDKARTARWRRWDTCSLCEQDYHGVVACALGWACWKTYLGRPETDGARILAMNVLGGGLADAKRHEDALTVREAELSMMRRIGASEYDMLAVQSNLASTYRMLGRDEEALRLRVDVYSGTLQLLGGEHRETLLEAFNYAACLAELERFEEAKSLLRKTMPVARRVLGESELMVRMKWIYGQALFCDPSASLDDLREAVTTLEETARTARRVLGAAHPITLNIEHALPEARATLGAGEGDDVTAVREGLDAMKAT
jgi:hypothetical protein